MLMQIVGVQPQDYRLDNGYSWKGLKIHAIDLDTKADGLLGNMIVNFKIGADHPQYNTPIQIGKKYKCFFDLKKGLDTMVLTEDEPANMDQFSFMDESELTKPSKK